MAKFSQYSLALWMALATSAESTSTTSSDEMEDRFNAAVDIQFGDDCGYELTFSFDHDEDLPIGTAALCQPNVIAEDGIPYLASRPKEYVFSDEIHEATGLASHSLDFESCGHPPLEQFGGPHYDSHFYVTTDRGDWTCDLLPGAPICNFLPGTQPTASGRAFFHAATVIGSDPPAIVDMPAGFECDPAAAVPNMGTHCWDFDAMPATYATWDTPTHIMGTYNADISFFEAMYAVGYVTGGGDNSYNSGAIMYESQTIPTLPSEFEVNYVASTGRTTIILRGTRANCGGGAFV